MSESAPIEITIFLKGPDFTPNNFNKAPDKYLCLNYFLKRRVFRRKLNIDLHF